MFAIESANIVGYQEIEVPTGYSLFTVTFQDVAGGAYDIEAMTPYDLDGNVATAGKITVQKMDTKGAYLQIYTHRSNKGGWCKGLSHIAEGAVTFANGEAVCINNTSGDIVKMRVSGQVNLDPWSMVIPTGYSLIGNMTPATIDIEDIIPYDLEGNVATAGKVTVQKMDNKGAYLQIYTHRSNKGGWCKGLTHLAIGDVVFAPGESACINNTSGASIQLKFKSPVAAE